MTVRLFEWLERGELPSYCSECCSGTVQTQFGVVAEEGCSSADTRQTCSIEDRSTLKMLLPEHRNYPHQQRHTVLFFILLCCMTGKLFVQFIRSYLCTVGIIKVSNLLLEAVESGLVRLTELSSNL